MNFSFRQLTFQSFGSVGPALNFVALLPLIAFFSGSMMPVVVTVAFIISFMSFLPIILFSSKISNGSGYAAYAMYSLGFRIAVFTGLVYIMYSILVIPNIIMFSSFFVQSYFISGNKIVFDLLFAAILIIFLSVPLLKRRNLAIFVITAIGMIEILGILVLSIAMILMMSNSTISISLSRVFSGNFWEGVMLGVLMFSGSGSGIFLFSKSSIPSTRVNKTLIFSYLITGFVMIISSYSLTVFLGSNINYYSSNPAILLRILGTDMGGIVPYLLVALLLLSAYNLMLSYSHALLNMYEDFQGMILRKMRYIKTGTFFIILLVLDTVIILISRSTIGFYNAFVVIAEIVSLSYVVVHIIVGLSLFNSRKFRREIRMVGLVSMSLLFIAMIGSLINSSGLFYLTLSSFIIIILISVLGSSLISRNYDRTESLHENLISS
jgi:amino acid transporter